LLRRGLHKLAESRFRLHSLCAVGKTADALGGQEN
jgi:hypothetical protein